MADWATLELMSAIASIVSSRRAVEGVVSRSTSTSSCPTRPMTRVSTWMPRAAASAASRWPRPVVSLPSEMRTIRFCAASGKSAAASRSAAPMSVAAFTGVLRIRSMTRSSSGSRSTSASLPKATMPAWSSSGMTSRVSRRNASASSRPSVPTLSERSTTNTVARRSTGSTSWKPASASTSADSRIVRTATAARRRLAPMRRRAARCGMNVRSSAGTSSTSQIAASKRMPISARPGLRRSPRHSRVTASRWYTSHSARSTTRTIRTITTHSSSRATGRSSATAPGAAEAPGARVGSGVPSGDAPGAADAPGCRPSATIEDGEPGAMSLSSASNRSTANRTGAFGIDRWRGGHGVPRRPVPASAQVRSLRRPDGGDRRGQRRRRARRSGPGVRATAV